MGELGPKLILVGVIIIHSLIWHIETFPISKQCLDNTKHLMYYSPIYSTSTQINRYTHWVVTNQFMANTTGHTMNEETNTKNIQ